MPVRALVVTISGCVIFAFLTWRVRGGVMFWVAVLPLGVWFLYSAYIIWRYPARRRLQIIQACLWLAVVGCACALHRYYYVSARAAANQIVQAVYAYKRQHGVYPERLEDAGVRLDERGGRWHIGYVVGDRKTHTLIYPATFMIFDSYAYEFEKGDWEYWPD
jgi:hypothetical protein